MALTFGTLLSSQGADAHRRNRFRLVGGNPKNTTLVGLARSNTTGTTQNSHLVGVLDEQYLVLGGNHSPGFTSPWASTPVLFVTPLREQEEH